VVWDGRSGMGWMSGMEWLSDMGWISDIQCRRDELG
jgi:hypothetical protein